MRKYQRQSPVGYRRNPYHTALISETKRAIDREANKYSVSKSFIIAVALAQYFGLISKRSMTTNTRYQVLENNGPFVYGYCEFSSLAQCAKFADKWLGGFSPGIPILLEHFENDLPFQYSHYGKNKVISIKVIQDGNPQQD